MKWRIFALLCLVAVQAEAKESTSTRVPRDQAEWTRLVSSTKALPESDLLSPREPIPVATRSERFYTSLAECSANAVALLNVNDLLPDRATMVKLRNKAAWDGKTAVFLLRSYSDGRDFMFLCLVDKDDKLERTRLIRPELKDRKFAVEIDVARYTYGGD